MHYNYKLDEQAITNILKDTLNLSKRKKEIKINICCIKFKTSNLIIKNNTNSAKIYLIQTNGIYKFICPFRECHLKKQNNSYISYATHNIISSSCLSPLWK